MLLETSAMCIAIAASVTYFIINFWRLINTNALLRHLPAECPRSRRHGHHQIPSIPTDQPHGLKPLQANATRRPCQGFLRNKLLYFLRESKGELVPLFPLTMNELACHAIPMMTSSYLALRNAETHGERQSPWDR